MLLVRATQKLRSRVKGSPVQDGDESTTALGDWFATALFWRPNVALLVNRRTLLPVYLELAPAARLLDRVPAAIEAVLEAHGVDDDFVAAEREAMRDVRIGPTNDRSVVGVMNEFAYLGKFHWADGVRDLRALSLRMAGTPLGPLQDRTGSPDRELAAVVGGDVPSARVIPFPTRVAADAPVRSPITSVFQLQVTLLDTQPPVWRRVLVDGGSTLAQLHDVIQAAFGWWNCHLHEFDDGRKRYGPPDCDPDADWEPPHDERRTRLDAIASEGTSLGYLYDFGDGWEHEIVVERVLLGSTDVTVPACVDGRRACPPEDCGGPSGYEQLLEILGDRNHPERDEYLEWLDRPFDPEAFDPSDFAANLREQQLGRLP
jgi:hypothetical protein